MAKKAVKANGKVRSKKATRKPEKPEKREFDPSEFEEKEKTIGQEILSTVIYLAVIVLFTFLIIKFVGQRTYVSGDSMRNTLSDGDNLIVDKISYRFHDPKRFDIIVFPFEDDTYYIKRIIGLPGETIQITDGVIYINDKQLVENYGREVMNSSGIAEEPITLGEDQYFVLGDNRNHSSDSRDPRVGIIDRDRLLGRAWLRIWPLNKIGFVKDN